MGKSYLDASFFKVEMLSYPQHCMQVRRKHHQHGRARHFKSTFFLKVKRHFLKSNGHFFVYCEILDASLSSTPVSYGYDCMPPSFCLACIVGQQCKVLLCTSSQHSPTYCNNDNTTQTYRHSHANWDCQAQIDLCSLKQGFSCFSAVENFLLR